MVSSLLIVCGQRPAPPTEGQNFSISVQPGIKTSDCNVVENMWSLYRSWLPLALVQLVLVTGQETTEPPGANSTQETTDLDVTMATDDVTNSTEDGTTIDATMATDGVTSAGQTGTTNEEQESDVTVADVPIDGSDLTPCDGNSHSGCNVTGFERCVMIRDQVGRCDCLSGYARTRTGSSCIAVKSFRGQLVTRNPFTEQHLDRGSSDYRLIEYEARELLFRAIMGSDLANILVDAKVPRLRKSDTDDVIVDFEVLVSRAYAPTSDQVQSDVISGINQVLVADNSSGYSTLQDTSISLSKGDIDALTITDPDPCSDPNLNHCDANADCSAWERSYICKCKENYEDVSPNKLEAPGEVCVLRCGCINGGQCTFRENGTMYCQCDSWFIGVHCEFDAKALIIALGTLLGAALLILGIGCCALCMWKNKARRFGEDDEEADDSSIISLPRAPSMSKLKPRSWTDSWNYGGLAGPIPHPVLRAHLTTPSRQGSWNMPLGVCRAPPGQMTIPRPNVLPAGPARLHKPQQWYWASSYT